MIDERNVDFKKFFSLSLILLLILQFGDFLVVKYFPHSINPQLIFGSVGNNIWAFIIALPILIFLIYLFLKKTIGLEVCLIIAGLISNLFDRIFYTGVIDYISLFFIPKFNPADILIVAGCAILVYKVIRTI